jgi:hypothetical protein
MFRVALALAMTSCSHTSRRALGFNESFRNADILSFYTDFHWPIVIGAYFPRALYIWAHTRARMTAVIRKKKKSSNLEDRVLVTRTPDEETEDGRIRNKEAVRKIRDTWIYKQVRARQDEFTQYRQVCDANDSVLCVCVCVCVCVLLLASCGGPVSLPLKWSLLQRLNIADF